MSTAKAQSRDTDLDAERVQIELLRQAGPGKRLALMRSLTGGALRRSRKSFRELHADLSEIEQSVLWVRLCYGDELADGLHADLLARGR